MSASRFTVVLALLATLTTTFAITTQMWNFTLSDAAANSNYAAGSREYHCFDIDGGNKIYVRGSYGNYGYFEGAVDSNNAQVFNVNWYEVAAGSMVATSGAATLTYAGNFATVTGPYWNTGSSDISGSYGGWNSINGYMQIDDSTTAGQETLLENCLYAGATVTAQRSNVQVLADILSDSISAVSGEGDAGQNTLCEMPAGTPGGSWLGTYKYEYEDGELEEGTYGTNPFGFWVESGFGFVGNWKANSGPYKGDSGSNIYMVTKSGADTLIVGFYCNIEGAEGSQTRTDCYSEYYEVNNEDNIGNCPASYRADGSLDPLWNFASTGSELSDDKYYKGEGLGVRMAILFGCLSGVLMAVVIFLSVTLYTKKE